MNRRVVIVAAAGAAIGRFNGAFKQADIKYGLAALCAGGGMGTALVLGRKS